MTNLYRIIIIVLLSVIPSYASGYDEYFKELEELKNVSTKIYPQVLKESFAQKNEYNQLARDVNKYIDYFTLLVDEKAQFDPIVIKKLIDPINIKAKKIQENLEKERELILKAYQTPAIILSIILTIEAGEKAYRFIKELNNDWEKLRLKKQLEEYKWEKA